MTFAKNLILLFLIAFSTSYGNEQFEETIYGVAHPKNVQVLLENGVNEAWP